MEPLLQWFLVLTAAILALASGCDAWWWPWRWFCDGVRSFARRWACCGTAWPPARGSACGWPSRRRRRTTTRAPAPRGRAGCSCRGGPSPGRTAATSCPSGAATTACRTRAPLWLSRGRCCGWLCFVSSQGAKTKTLARMPARASSASASSSACRRPPWPPHRRTWTSGRGWGGTSVAPTGRSLPHRPRRRAAPRPRAPPSCQLPLVPWLWPASPWPWRFRCC
mmetsp:Transcript_174977/g.561123  ORF Transcript_174977/g.561123 Transcript_174977/m.561123 type:complete len:223 (+) Transcript_174977:810-1478(+)